MSTSGSAYVGGSVNVGGDFVRRDQHIHYQAPPEAELEPIAARYRELVAERCGQLPLRGVDLEASDATSARWALSLAGVYTTLDTKTEVSGEALEKALRLP